MPTGNFDSENPTAAPFLVDEAATVPWLVITVVTRGNVVGWVIALAGTVEAAIVEADITVDVYTTTDASSVIGMALPTPVPVHWGGMESVAVLGLADSSFE